MNITSIKILFKEQFWDWLFDKNTEHSYWFYKNGKKEGCSYRSNAFVEWLNLYPLKNEDDKACIISEYTSDYDKLLPSIHFKVSTHR